MSKRENATLLNSSLDDVKVNDEQNYRGKQEHSSDSPLKNLVWGKNVKEPKSLNQSSHF